MTRGPRRACGIFQRLLKALLPDLVSANAPADTPGPPVHSGGFFHFTTRRWSISDKADFLEGAGTSRAAASAILTRSRSACSSRYSVGSEQSLVGAPGFVR